jgi:hypothetical protein
MFSVNGREEVLSEWHLQQSRGLCSALINPLEMREFMINIALLSTERTWGQGK